MKRAELADTTTRGRGVCFTALEQKRKQKSRGIVPPAFSRLPVRRRRFKKARKKARRGFKKARKRKKQKTANCKRQNLQTQAYQRVQGAKPRQAAAAENSFGLIGKDEVGSSNLPSSSKMNDPTQFEQVDETCGSGRVVLHLKSLGMTVFFEDIIPKRI